MTTAAFVKSCMSHSDYTRWFMENFSKSNPSNSMFANAIAASIQQDQVDQNFDLIRQSEFLHENFIQFPNAVRRSVVPFVTRACPIAHIEAFAQQALKMIDHSVRFDFEAADSNEISDSLQARLAIELADSEVIDFEKLLSDYVALYDAKWYDGEFSPMLIGNVVRMLTLVHGASVVIEVLRRWNVDSCPEQLDDFIAVVENWSTVQEYPIHWAIAIARGESVE